MNTRTRWAAIAAVTAGLAFTGCTSTDTDKVIASSTTAPSIDALFAEAVRDNTDIERSATDAEIVELGHLSCDLVDTAEGNFDLVGLMMVSDPDVTDDEIADLGFILGASVETYCPRWSGALERYLGES